ncbi:MAG: hypothetical protein D6696_01370 [Acidobacteria bacterium]|nr:MAG: hypothetical protein D6696_01370 [Acidobacteriota bacterium]
MTTSRVVLWLALVASVLRLAYLTEHAGSAFFAVPILDEAYYDGAARAFLGGDPQLIAGGFRPLLYPLFLALCYRLGGAFDVLVALAAQHALGVLTVVLVALMAARLWRRPAAAAVAGGLYALAGPPLYFEGELLIVTLFTFLVALNAYLVLRAVGGGALAWRWWLGAGLLTGVAAQARANALIFAAAYPLLGAVAERRRPRRAAALVALALAGVLAVQLAAAALAAPLTGRFQLLPSAGGVNLYLGNKRGADGMIPRQDRPVTYGEAYRDSVEVFAEEDYRAALAAAGITPPATVDPAAVSRYWLGRTWAEIRADPGAWLALLGRKVGYLASAVEIPNNKSFGFVAAHESRLLRLLPVRWWLLFALAPLGAVAAWQAGRRPQLWALTAIAGLHAAGVVAFFVNSRYRLPLWPLLAVLAAGGVTWLAAALRRRRWRQLLVGLAAAAVVAASSLLLAPPPAGWARDYYFRSLANLTKGRLEAALADVEASLALDSTDGAAFLQLGNVLRARGDLEAAVAAYRAAAARLPGEPRIENNLGVALEELGRTAEAYRHYLRAIDVEPSYAPPWVNAALLELRAGLTARAEDRIARAESLGFESPSSIVARALLARARGDEAGFEALLAPLRENDEETVARLLEEHGRPLAPAVLLGEDAAGGSATDGRER